MVVKHCCYGLCKSDSRKNEEKVVFLPFPKPITQAEKCLKWIKLCGRPHNDFNVSKISKYTYICSKHFVGGAGPTDLYPDPVPAIQTGSTTTSIKKARRPPRVRSSTPDIERRFISDHDYARACSIDDNVEISIQTDEGENMDISFSSSSTVVYVSVVSVVYEHIIV